MTEQLISELIDELSSSFCARQISYFLEETGLLTNTFQYTIEQFDKYIFLRGNQEEIYTRKERTFIEKLGSVVVYSDYYKKTKRGYMPCRVVAVDLSLWSDDVYIAVLFMKIVIKAIGGFTIFVMKLNSGIHLGIRMFDKVEWKNCTLSEPGKLSAIIEGVMWMDECDDFLKYYSILTELIKPVSIAYVDYDEMILKKRGMQSDYIELLNEIEYMYGESVQTELRRYQDFFDEEYKIDYAESLESYLEELKNVQSLKVNTLEMLFEADELERVISKAEDQHNKYLDGLSKKDSSRNDMDMMEEMNSDPEAVIKKLKSLKGLI